MAQLAGSMWLVFCFDFLCVFYILRKSINFRLRKYVSIENAEQDYREVENTKGQNLYLRICFPWCAQIKFVQNTKYSVDDFIVNRLRQLLPGGFQVHCLKYNKPQIKDDGQSGLRAPRLPYWFGPTCMVYPLAPASKVFHYGGRSQNQANQHIRSRTIPY